jgi:hypothetical protein
MRTLRRIDACYAFCEALGFYRRLTSGGAARISHCLGRILPVEIAVGFAPFLACKVIVSRCRGVTGSRCVTVQIQDIQVIPAAADGLRTPALTLTDCTGRRARPSTFCTRKMKNDLHLRSLADLESRSWTRLRKPASARSFTRFEKGFSRASRCSSAFATADFGVIWLRILYLFAADALDFAETEERPFTPFLYAVDTVCYMMWWEIQLLIDVNQGRTARNPVFNQRESGDGCAKSSH